MALRAHALGERRDLAPPLTSMLDHAPRFAGAAAERFAREVYGRPGRARALTSERDQNFLIEEPGGGRFVLKIANALEQPALLDAQRCAMDHLASRVPWTPRVVLTQAGLPAAEVQATDGRRHRLWAVTHLPGEHLASLRHRPPRFLEQLGRDIGTLAAGLADFDHPAIHRDFHWDLAAGAGVVESRLPLVHEPVASAVRGLAARFERYAAPLLADLPRRAVHGDLNDHNLLVGGGYADPRLTGVVDFGDMVFSYAAGDLAIAAAYALLDAGDPLAVLAAMVRGYHGVRALSAAEVECVFELACLRLSMSACIAAEQQSAQPDNAYLSVSQAAIARTLPVLASVPHGLAAAVARDAAGLEPVPASVAVRRWLGAQTDDFAPVLPHDLRTAPCIVLDLSVASALVAGDERENAEPRLTPRIFGAMQDAGVRVGVGRYDEPRLLYTSPAFAGAGPADERRTIHIGLDLFADAGTPVFAPLEGTVHAFADNAAPCDYGPVIVLRHETDDGTQFFTLYGHLTRSSLPPLQVGQRVARGAQIATLGAPAENGEWTPHLHLQIITDLLDLGTDFPGVGRAGERRVWRSLSPDPNLLVGIPAARFPAAVPDKAQTVALRREKIGHNLSVAYRDPVKVVRGWMQYLYDDEGRRYVDAYNNVPHVGHAHPRVVRAAREQMALLNTNTRYPSDLLNEYASRLTALFPGPLRDGVAFFVNSASEANELALRLARAHTRRRDVIVLAGAYHGNTTSLIDISPYKHDGPGGGGAPDWVHVAPLADDYRGAYRRADPQAGPKYARAVAELATRLVEGGRGLCAFIAESCPSVGGQILFPPGYLANVYRAVRAAGGVCIADEVQTGLGRLGTHTWAFETQDVVPDIVVLGKPLGNGHPIGAVVATAEIAASFDDGMEFFSTFGGNTVSCAVGLAVLDVLRDEALPSHAQRVGDRLLAGLRTLSDHPLVGDVRGSGLFAGVELVRDRGTLEPAGAEASHVAERMREKGILLGTDGPYHNVVKIRPPMPFSEEDAERLVGALRRILDEELSGARS